MDKDHKDEKKPYVKSRKKVTGDSRTGEIQDHGDEKKPYLKIRIKRYNDSENTKKGEFEKNPIRSEEFAEGFVCGNQRLNSVNIPRVSDKQKKTSGLSTESFTEDDLEVAEALIMLSERVVEFDPAEALIKLSEDVDDSDKPNLVEFSNANPENFMVKDSFRSLSNKKSDLGHHPMARLDESQTPFQDSDHRFLRDNGKNLDARDDADRKVEPIRETGIKISESVSSNLVKTESQKKSVHKCDSCGGVFASYQGLGSHRKACVIKMKKPEGLDFAGNRSECKKMQIEDVAEGSQQLNLDLNKIPIDLNFPPLD